MNISIYKNISDTKSQDTTLLDQFLQDVKNGKWQTQVERVRQTQDPEQKKSVPLVTVSGQFKERNASGIISHSGFICIDIDGIEPAQMVDVANKLWTDPYTYACFKSIRGNGLAVVVRIDPARHLDAFEGLERYYAQQYQISIDRSCKDVSRTRFVSYDPSLYLNSRSQIFKKYIPKKETPKTENYPNALATSDFHHILDQISTNKIDITQGQYYIWLRVGFAIADYFDESGRSYFHTISQNSEKYDPKVCDKQYSACLKSRGQGIQLGTFIHWCKEAGINTTSTKTKRTLQAVYHAKKQGRTKESVVDLLTKLDGMDATEATDLVNRAFNNATPINDKNFSAVDTIEIFVNSNYKLLRNLITNRLENNGEIFTQIDENTMYINLKKIEPKVSQELLSTYIRSNEIPSYHPLQDFIGKYEHRQPVGVIKSIAETIHGYNGYLPDGEIMHDYVEVFLTKFYLGLIAGALGDETPPIIPVIYGEKIGTGKTQFWKRLLPDELSNYFAISDLSRGQDDDILLSMKWMVCDDEWAGKMANNTKYMKSKSGQTSSTIRRAYARDHEDIKRLAMLCGTSNDSDIIADSSNRRIIPINATHIDLERYYKIDKIDALIEAYHLYTSAGESPFLTSYENDMLQRISSLNTAPDVNEELLLSFFESCEPDDTTALFKSATDVASFIQSKTQLRISVTAIGKALAKNGFLKVSERKNGAPRYAYVVKPIRQE